MIKVYHATVMLVLPTHTELMEAASKYLDPAHYTLVAEVKTNDLDIAFELTNSINHYWGDNDHVKDLGNRTHRSTSVGDVLVAGDKVYAVASFGFEEVKECHTKLN